MVRPKENPLKTVNPVLATWRDGDAVVSYLADRIDLAVSATASTKRPQGLASHAARFVDTEGARAVSLLVWDCVNEIQNLAYVAARTSHRQGRITSAASPAAKSTKLRTRRNSGTAITSKRATTKPGLITTRGEVVRHTSTTSALGLKPTVKIVSDAAEQPPLCITRTATTPTRTHRTWNRCASAVTSWSTTVRPTCPKLWRLNGALIVRSFSSPGAAEHCAVYGADTRGKHARRHSQCPSKDGNNTVAYGMGVFALSKTIGCSEDKAQQILDTFFGKYPAVKKYCEDAVEDAIARDCSAYTLLGRRRRLPGLLSSDKSEYGKACRRATNHPIQGSNADIMKLAMIKMDYELDIYNKYGARLLLQIYDELVCECPKETSKELERDMKECLEHALPGELRTPIAASLGRGANWLVAK